MSVWTDYGRFLEGRDLDLEISVEYEADEQHLIFMSMIFKKYTSL